MTAPSLARAGQCIACGCAVSRHFDNGNRFVGCTGALLTQQQLQTISAQSQQPHSAQQAPSRVVQFGQVAGDPR